MNHRFEMVVAIMATLLMQGVSVLGAAEKIPLQMGVPFGDGAVLQQQTKVPVWGWTVAKAKVTVRFAGQEVSVTADETGKWVATLRPLEADKVTDPAVAPTGKTMTVTASKDAATVVSEIKDILVGEVWFCAGQSNMGWGLTHVINGAHEIAKAQYPVIRKLPMGARATAIPMEKGPVLRWVPCTPAVAPNFTATGYYFARNLLEELKVPIGLLHVTRGGGVIEPFISPGAYLASKKLPKERAFVARSMSVDALKSYARFEKDYSKWFSTLKKRADGTLVAAFPMPALPGFEITQPSVGFNNAIMPLIPYAMRGAIWYQGESNAIHSKPKIKTGRNYLFKMEALVDGWRKLWGLGDFPFYYVQLANFGGSKKTPEMGDATAMIRQAQLEALKIKNTGMAVMIDGNGSIHPPNKQETGRRLALWALAKQYGRKDIVFSGPLYKSFRIQGSKIRIIFNHAESGLMAAKKEMLKPAVEDKGAKIEWLSIQGKDKKWHWADGVFDGNDLIVSSEDVTEPIAVRYAYSANPKGCNLYNRAGLPAATFTTTDY